MDASEAEELLILLHHQPPTGESNMFHVHSCFELAYVYRGSCVSKHRDYDIELSQGSLLLMNPNEIHCMCTGSDEDVVFNFLLPEKLLYSTALMQLPKDSISDFIMEYFCETRSGNDFLVTNVSSDEWILRLLEQLIYEYHRPSPGHEVILKTGLTQLLVCMARHYIEPLIDLPLQRTSGLVHDLLMYIKKNIASVTLADAAREFSYNAQYISRIIKKEIGMSFSQYVQRQRLQIAVEYLSKTNLSVEKIANRVGYTNISHFYDLFQKQYGMTPTAYRSRLHSEPK